MKFEIYRGTRISVGHYHICPACDEMWEDCEKTDCIGMVEQHCDGCRGDLEKG